MTRHDDSEFPVLLAGGGLVGLSTAMFLAQHGIPSIAVERLHRGSQLPRAAFFHMRTLELFRAAGIEDMGLITETATSAPGSCPWTGHPGPTSTSSCGRR